MERQLGDYGGHLQQLVDEMAVPEVRQPAVELTPTVVGVRRRWLVAAAAFLTPLGLIGGVALMATLGGDDPVGGIEEPTTVTTTIAESTMVTTTFTGPTTVTTLPPPPTTVVEEAPPPSTWTLIDAGDLVGGRVASGPMGMVALVTNTELTGTSWFSEDGETWEPLPVAQGVDVAYGDPGFVICCHDTGHRGDFMVRDAFSFSPDGVTWVTTEFEFDGSDRREPGTYLSVGAVTFGDGKFVAVGEAIEVDAELEAAAYSLATWNSVDGTTWTLQSTIEVPDVAPSCNTPNCWILDVAFGHAGFVAVGDGVGDAITWLSTDGRTWTRTESPPVGDGYGWGRRITYLDGAYFTVGGATAEQGPRDAIWRSTDGVSWEVVLVNPDSGDIADIVHGDSGYLAVGRSGDTSGDTGAAVWHSTDGVTWTGPTHDPGVFTDTWFHGAGYIEGRYVLFGEANGASPQYGRIFISE